MEREMKSNSAAQRGRPSYKQRWMQYRKVPHELVRQNSNKWRKTNPDTMWFPRWIFTSHIFQVGFLPHTFIYCEFTWRKIFRPWVERTNHLSTEQLTGNKDVGSIPTRSRCIFPWKITVGDIIYTYDVYILYILILTTTSHLVSDREYATLNAA